MLDGSDSGELNALAVTDQGEHFVSGGEDKVVKLWDYDEGIIYFQGVGHSGGITKIAIAPNQQFFVSTGVEGGIFRRSDKFKLNRTLNVRHGMNLGDLEVRSRGFAPHRTNPPRESSIAVRQDGTLSLATLRSRGFEPPWVAPLPPQGSASASFATSA